MSKKRVETDFNWFKLSQIPHRFNFFFVVESVDCVEAVSTLRLQHSSHKRVTGSFGAFSSVAKREVPCYLPGSFTSSGPDLLRRNIAFIAADLDSFSYRTQELLLKNICHIRPVANSISPLQTEPHFLFERTAGVQHLCVLLDGYKGLTKALIFPKLSEIYFY